MIRISICIFFISAASSLLAQDEKGKNTNVELPDFVITGSDVSTLQKGKKIDHDYIERPGMHDNTYWSKASAFQLLFIHNYFSQS